MDGTIARSGKRFISLKWRALILTSALLVVVFAIFLLSTRYSGQIQLRELSKERAQRYVEQFEALLQQQQQSLESAGRILLQIEGVRDAIIAGDQNKIERQIDPFWRELKQESAINSVAIFSPTDSILVWLGDPSIPPDLMEKFQLNRKTRGALSCFETCEMYVAVPLELSGWGKGLVVFGAQLNQVVSRFQAVSKTSLLLAVRRDQRQSQDDGYYMRGWGSELVIVDQDEYAVDLLKGLSTRYSRAEVFSGILDQRDNIYLEELLRRDTTAAQQ